MIVQMMRLSRTPDTLRWVRRDKTLEGVTCRAVRATARSCPAVSCRHPGPTATKAALVVAGADILLCLLLIKITRCLSVAFSQRIAFYIDKCKKDSALIPVRGSWGGHLPDPPG